LVESLCHGHLITKWNKLVRYDTSIILVEACSECGKVGNTFANLSLNRQVDVAELRQKLQTMETLQKELELLRRQKAASEQAALNAKQRQGSGGMWGWLAGSPPSQNDEA
jgi:hypothetical protein